MEPPHQFNDSKVVLKMTDDEAARHQLPTVSDVNCHLVCSVCKGYLIDATTITECLHSFCRSCVIPHVTEFHECPSCSVPLSTTKPFSQLRRDYTLQSIVYKMVPRLARNELERRKQFTHQHSQDLVNSVHKTEERYLQSFFAPNDPISLSLEYAEPNCAFGLGAKFGNKGLKSENGSVSSEHHRRFFRCPAELPIGHLVKFLRCKFNVMNPATHKLEILYNGRPLAPEYKLSDVAYIFSWKEKEPLRLWYRILPSTVSKEEEPHQPAVVSQRKIIPAEEVKSKTTNQQRASLVDITSKRQWNGKDDQRSRCNNNKRRKRSAEKQAEKMNLPMLKTAVVAPTAAVDSLLVTAAANKTIFDESRSSEFSCSTPIPNNSVPENVNADAESNKVQNWLPKAVFDLDDRALFAKRLQRITNNPSDDPPEADEEKSVPESIKTETSDEQPLKEEAPINVAVSSKEELEEEEVAPSVLDSSSDIPGPLRICVTPEPTEQNDDEEDEVHHDSIGALDLSGSKGDSSTDISSPLSSGSCRSSAISPVGPSGKVMGPHPYFMTPSAVYHSVQQQDPAQSMAALAAAASSAQQKRNNKNKNALLSKSDTDVNNKSNNNNPAPPLWDLFQHIRPSSAHDGHHQQSLLSLLKSNPILFPNNNDNNNKKKKNKKKKLPPSSPKSA